MRKEVLGLVYTSYEVEIPNEIISLGAGYEKELGDEVSTKVNV